MGEIRMSDPETLTDYLITHYPDAIVPGETSEQAAIRVMDRLRAERDRWHHQFLLRDGHYDRLVERYFLATGLAP